ncbi:MAG: translational GTPase TypA [Candidatus Komeilibacteria bacterium]
MTKKIRNIAIIAHVDHGKTTLVDALLRQSEKFTTKIQTDLIMDSNELERERGITIFSKNAAVTYKGYKINIVDTPGHADFGGEVERIMSLVDGVLLLVDAKDGPMPQTKFVLSKALQAGHKVIVVINKIDLSEARPQWVLNQTFDLFVELGANDDQVEFPVIYASATAGKAGLEAHLERLKDVQPVFDAVIKYIPAPKVGTDPMQMLVVNIAYDNFKGQIAIGRLLSGTLKQGQSVVLLKPDGTKVSQKISSVMIYDGLLRKEVSEVEAGDIIAVAGVDNIRIGDTIADITDPRPLAPINIEEPTVKMNFAVNNSPFYGQDGTYQTARHLKERLQRELLNDVALKVEPSEGTDSAFTVSGRGELHLSILIEKMRREGFEFQVSKPQVIFKEKGDQKLEPYEEVFIECPEAVSGMVIEKMGKRKGLMKNMKVDRGQAHLHFVVPTRGLIGYRSEFLTDTKGQGIINTLFHGYEAYGGDLESNNRGSLVAFEAGISNLYGLLNAQERGQLFIGPAVKVYEGMIVGKNSRSEDLEVNICKTKQLSNMRSKGDGKADHFDTPVNLSLEEAIEYIGEDELLEVTPKNLRLRKTILNSLQRKRSGS